MRKFGLLLVLALGFLANAAAVAEDASPLKIGVVNMREILQRAPQATAVATSLEKEFAKRKEDIVQMRSSLQNKADKLKRDQEVLSEAERKKLEKDIISSQRDLENKERDFQQEGMERQREETQKVLKVVSEIVNEIAAKDKYDIILHRDAAPFITDKVDITKQVLEKMIAKNTSKEATKESKSKKS